METTRAIDWHDYIASDPAVVGGKPAVRGTRLHVAFIFKLFAEGWTVEEVLREYPGLDVVRLQAVFAYAQAFVDEALTARKPSLR